MDTFLGVRPGRREDSGTSVLLCPICGISNLNQDMSWSNYPAIDGCLNQQLRYPSHSFFSSPSLSHSPLPPFNLSGILLLHVDLW